MKGEIITTIYGKGNNTVCTKFVAHWRTNHIEVEEDGYNQIWENAHWCQNNIPLTRGYSQTFGGLL